MAMMLQGKIALITGTRGIGGACARLLAERGATIITLYKQNQAAAEQLVESIGGDARAFQVDVLDSQQVYRLMAEIERTYGRLDILVSNAAVGWMEKAFDQLTWPEFSNVVNNELKAAFDLTQAALPLMVKQQSGRLIYMASNLATHTLQNTIASSAAKAALTAFMRNIAAEYGYLNAISSRSMAAWMCCLTAILK